MDSLTRLQKLSGSLPSLAIDALLVENPTALYYLTGSHFSAGTLLVGRQEAHLFVDGRYLHSAQQNVAIPSSLVEPHSLCEWCQRQGVKVLGIAAETTSVARFQAIQTLLEGRGVELRPLPDPVAELRIVKSPQEIASLRKAGELTVVGIHYAESLLQEGVQESEVALELELFWRRQGGERLAFDPIIAFGPNSAMPHYRAGVASLGMEEAVLIDVGVVVNGYHGDATRFFPRNDPSPQLRAAHSAVYEAQQAAIAAVQPGVPLGRLDEIAREVLRKHSLEPYFTHSLGHGIGLEIHEAPRLKSGGPDSERVCQPGMVFTIEPGVYLPGIGGVRLEEMVLVTETGYEVLTKLP